MSTKPSWKSFFDHNEKADTDFLKDRSPVITERCRRCRMDGKIEFDGKDFFVVIPQKLLDRAGMSAGDEVEVSGDRLSQGYVITIERSSDDSGD